MANYLRKFSEYCFVYIFKSNLLIFGHICKKMFRSSRFSILARCFLYVLAKGLIWSFQRLRPLWGLCCRSFDTLFCKQFSFNIFFKVIDWSLVIFERRCYLKSIYHRASCLIYVLAKCLIWSFSKSQALTRVLWQQVDWILGHICNEMFGSS